MTDPSPGVPASVSDEALQDVVNQLGPELAPEFVERDLAPLLGWLGLASTLEALERGPWVGGRLAVSDPVTVGAFSLFVALDADGRPSVYAVDIWLDGWPVDPDDGTPGS